MENFFDIATPEELDLILGEDDPDLPTSMRGYVHEKALAQEDADYHCGLLSTLYANRDDMQRAEDYIAMIKDEERRLCASMMLHECAAGY
jgi:hypothetical protein